MENWIAVIHESELAEGKPVKLNTGGKPIVLLRVEGEIYALLNQCPHLGCFMHKGKLSGHLLTCPCHDWVFDVRTGEFISAPEIKIPVFSTKVEKGQIFLNIGGVL
jgi:3-phenylpropionate/trans-cinnamate dioxygenase ferredoxin subunit